MNRDLFTIFIDFNPLYFLGGNKEENSWIMQEDLVGVVKF